MIRGIYFFAFFSKKLFIFPVKWCIMLKLVDLCLKGELYDQKRSKGKLF